MNEKLLFELKLKIAQSIMFNINIDQFISKLIEIEHEMNNNFKADRIKELYFNSNFIKNEDCLISCSMIVKNEEDFLEKSLASISEIADEIIIVDTGSTDRTKEIASKYTDKIYDFVWQDDFSLARNFSLDKCNGDWIIYLDADEELTHNSQKSIRKMIEETPEEIGLINVKIINKRFSDKEANYEGIYPRVFRNLGFPLVHYFGKIHEQISPSLKNFDFKDKNSDLEIIHSGYAISEKEMTAKLKRNLTILSKHVEEEPTNGYTWYQLGNTFYQMKEYTKAIETLENALMCGNLTKHLSSNTALTIANSYHKLNNITKAVNMVAKSINYNSNNEAAINLFDFLTKQK